MASEITDRQAAEDAFDAILGDAGSYAEWGMPSYKENAIRTLTEHISEQHRAAVAELVEALAEVFADHGKVNSLAWTDKTAGLLSRHQAGLGKGEGG